MRRSRSIRLLLLSSVGALTLTACDEGDRLAEGEFITDQAQCAVAFDPKDCRDALAAARAEHVKTAPTFATRKDCEAQFGAGNCDTRAAIASAEPGGTSTGGSGPTGSSGGQPGAGGSGGLFMPMLMGYMLGRTMSGFAAQPLYRDASNTAYTGGKSVGSVDSIRSRAPAPGARIGQTVSRGGFGQEGAQRSSAT
ncbi:MAG: DUF1190 domain-containing protein [Alphaproteobacteria bacterium]